MELLDPRRLDRIRAWFSETLSRIQGGDSKPKLAPETLRWLRGIALLMGSCIFAWASMVSTREMTIIEYRSSHRPDASFWRAILRFFGYRPIESGEERERILRSSEAFRGETLEVRMSPGLQTLVFPHGALGEHFEVWHRDFPCPAPKEWSRIPISLSGLESMRILLEANPIPTSPKTRPRTKFVDPKEIRY